MPTPANTPSKPKAKPVVAKSTGHTATAAKPAVPKSTSQSHKAAKPAAADHTNPKAAKSSKTTSTSAAPGKLAATTPAKSARAPAASNKIIVPREVKDKLAKSIDAFFTAYDAAVKQAHTSGR